MKKNYFRFCTLIIITFSLNVISSYGQISNNPAPYCTTPYVDVPCAQPGSSNQAGNFFNDFINGFNTAGANINITNNNSGCNGNPNNYIYYNCIYPLQVSAGQIITCNAQSGNVYAQGFAVFIDWNQNNIFDLPQEEVCGTPGVPAAAAWTAITFTVPTSQPNGIYRMRVRCVYVTAANLITPCGTHPHGEVEDYNVYIGVNPPSPPISYTISANTNTICSGGSAVLTATGATSYTWQPGGYLGSPISVSPTVSTIYSVTTNDTSSCAVSQAISITVNICTSLEQKELFENSLQVIPNPFKDEFTLKVIGEAEIKLYNTLGQLLLEKTIFIEEKIHTETLSEAIYYLSVSNKDGNKVLKIIKN
jgi:hypothetical protein